MKSPTRSIVEMHFPKLSVDFSPDPVFNSALGLNGTESIGDETEEVLPWCGDLELLERDDMADGWGLLEAVPGGDRSICKTISEEVSG